MFIQEESERVIERRSSRETRNKSSAKSPSAKSPAVKTSTAKSPVVESSKSADSTVTVTV